MLSIVSAAILALAPMQDDDEDQLTPEQAMEMLKDIQGMMTKAEELLNDSSRGKALATEKDLIEKLDRELRDDPTALQKQILEKVKKLNERTEKKQKDAVDKLAELIKKAKSSSGQGKGEKKDPQGKNKAKPKNPSDPATDPYDPSRNDPPSKFRSEADKTGSWGDLPAKVRDAMLHGRRDVDDYPAEFQQMLKEYMEKLSGSDHQ